MLDLDHFKEILLEEKEKLNAGLAHSEDLLKADDQELGDYDTNHPADFAADQVDKDVARALGSFQEHELHDIDEALEAIEKGTYGRCKVCGAEIERERLEVVPSTLYCVVHVEE